MTTCSSIYHAWLALPDWSASLTLMLAFSGLGALAGAIAMWLWFTWRYRVGLEHQRLEDSLNAAFRMR